MDVVQRLIYRSHSDGHLKEVPPPSPPPPPPPPIGKKVTFFPTYKVEYLPAWSEFELDNFKKDLWWQPKEYEEMQSRLTRGLNAYAKLHNVTLPKRIQILALPEPVKNLLDLPEPVKNLDEHSTPSPT